MSQGTSNGFCPHCAREWIIHGRSVYGAPCKRPEEHHADWQGARFVLSTNKQSRSLYAFVQARRAGEAVGGRSCLTATRAPCHPTWEMDYSPEGQR